jgi:hypothetical protein
MSYVFDMNITSGRDDDSLPGTWSPRAIDVIEIESVRWADGSHDGTPKFPRLGGVVESDAGRRLQLRRIVDALRTTLAEPRAEYELLATVKRRLDALPDAEVDQLQGA